MKNVLKFVEKKGRRPAYFYFFSSKERRSYEGQKISVKDVNTTFLFLFTKNSKKWLIYKTINKKFMEVSHIGVYDNMWKKLSLQFLCHLEFVKCVLASQN